MTGQSTMGISVEPARQSVTEQIFEALQDKILRLELPPNSKVSEIEVARQSHVSRQPVRDAFYQGKQAATS